MVGYILVILPSRRCCRGMWFPYGGDLWLFMCFRKTAKSDYQFRHVWLSALHMEQLRSHWTDFHEIWYLRILRKISRENSRFNKIGQEWRVLYMKTNTHFLSYLAYFFIEWDTFQSNVVEKIKAHILCSVTFISKILSFIRKCRKIL